MTRPIFLKCDTGIDDAFAPACLLVEPTADPVGITTVRGDVLAT